MWNGLLSMKTEFSTLYVDSGLNFSSLRGKNQFPNQLHGSNTYFWKRASKKNTFCCWRHWRTNCTRWLMLTAFPKRTRNWDFGNNIFHGTVDSVRGKVCSTRCRILFTFYVIHPWNAQHLLQQLNAAPSQFQLSSITPWIRQSSNPGWYLQGHAQRGLVPLKFLTGHQAPLPP